MPTRFSVTCGDEQARAIQSLARRYGLTEEEVIAQLIELGLEEVDEERRLNR